MEDGFNQSDRRASGTDHDLIVELTVEMKNVRQDIKDLKDGVKTSIADHETRINKLETSLVNLNTLLSIGIGILTLLTSLLIYHIMGK